MVVEQCRTPFEHFKQWAILSGAQSAPERWHEVQHEFYTLVNTCSQKLSGWSAPYQFVDLQKMVQSQAPASTTAVLEQGYRKECTAKMDEFIQWFAYNDHLAGQPRKAARQAFHDWVNYCTGHIPGWQSPIIVPKE